MGYGPPKVMKTQQSGSSVFAVRRVFNRADSVPHPTGGSVFHKLNWIAANASTASAPSARFLSRFAAHVSRRSAAAQPDIAAETENAVADCPFHHDRR
jgi:hypothetical protein